MDRIKRFVLRVEFIPYVIFTVIGVSVLYVVGSILVNAISNRSLIPPPTRLDRYECSAPTGNFAIFYLHGTDRVQIKSDKGVIDGTVHQNRFDWQGFADDRSVLGFAPPSEILFEDAKAMRVFGADKQEVSCINSADAASHQRSINK